VDISEDLLYTNLTFNKPIVYSENITLYPVRMENIFEFQQYSTSFTIRKNSVFPIKEIIKMNYLDFLFYCSQNPEFGIKYNLPHLSLLYMFAGQLLSLVCKNQEVSIGTESAFFRINGELIDSEKFDDLRKIIIIQNDVDFNIDEFLNRDTEDALKKAQEFEDKKKKEKSSIEDYIDSIIIGLKVTEEYVQNITIRKFWRYVKRISKHEEYQIFRSAECGGMVTFKEPIQHWMTTLEVEDKYSNLKTDEQELRSKIE